MEDNIIEKLRVHGEELRAIHATLNSLRGPLIGSGQPKELVLAQAAYAASNAWVTLNYVIDELKKEEV